MKGYSGPPNAVQRGLLAGIGGVCMLLLGGCGNSPHGGRSSASCAYTPATTAGYRSYCGKSSWTAGVTELCGGHLVYRDYLYDDYGADAPIPTIRWTPTSSNASVLPTGDDAYPSGAENTADLVRFEMWPQDGRMQVEVELNTLYAAGQTRAVLLIDRDNDASTGGGPWPGFNTASAGWDEIHVFASGDPATNLIRGDFPRPPGNAWKLWLAVAQADGTVMNLAFRGSGETSTGSWFDDAQAKALAAGDVSAFSVGVCPAELDAGVTRGAALAPGYHERVYTSAYTLPPGEGISVAGIDGSKVNRQAGDPRVYQAFNFLGRYQPYAFYLPDLAGPHGLQLFLHGFSQTHAANLGTASVQQAFGDALNRVLVSPLGRGLAGAYSDVSERDVLDVLDDALAFFDADPEQVIVSGVSMGGYGQLAFGTLYPDRFAGMIGWVSPTGNFGVFPAGQPLTYIPGSLVANTADLVPNLANVPSVLLYGALDEFVPVFEAQAMLDRLKVEDGLRFDYFLHLNTDHLTTLGIDQTKEAVLSDGWHRPARVARVRYRYAPDLDVLAYAIAHDRAYWVSDIRARTAAYADVDLRSAGCGLPNVLTETGSEPGTGPVPVIWQHDFRRTSGTTPTVASQQLDGTLSNVASLSLDLAGACLGASSLDYGIETDGPAQIHLSDGRSLTLPAPGVYHGTLQP